MLKTLPEYLQNRYGYSRQLLKVWANRNHSSLTPFILPVVIKCRFRVA